MDLSEIILVICYLFGLIPVKIEFSFFYFSRLLYLYIYPRRRIDEISDSQCSLENLMKAIDLLSLPEKCAYNWNTQFIYFGDTYSLPADPRLRIPQLDDYTMSLPNLQLQIKLNVYNVMKNIFEKCVFKALYTTSFQKEETII